MSFTPELAHSGYVDRSKIRTPYVKVHPIVTSVMARFIAQPTLIISDIFIPAASYAIALGAVVNGNIKENEQMNTAGRQNRRGLIQLYDD